MERRAWASLHSRLTAHCFGSKGSSYLDAFSDSVAGTLWLMNRVAVLWRDADVLMSSNSETFVLLEDVLRGISKSERGAVVRQVAELAESELQLEDGGTEHLSRATLYRMLAAVREGGAKALMRQERSDKGTIRAIPPAILERLIALRTGRAHEAYAALGMRPPNKVLEAPDGDPKASRQSEM